MKALLIVSIVALLHALVCHSFAYANTATSPVALLSNNSVAPLSNVQTKRLILNAELGLADADGWAGDLHRALRMGNLPGNKENVCAMVAVIDQESGFASNPVIPNLGNIAAKELANKVDFLSFRAASGLLDYADSFPNKRDSYLKRIRKARTEKTLDLVYRDFMKSIFNQEFSDFFTDVIEQHNEIDTIGSMQVAVSFAVNQEAAKLDRELTLPETWALRDRMYTRFGGLYFGALQLLGYDSGYSQKIHRFADFNAGRYASRNAAFQFAVAKLLKTKLALDGDLLGYASNGTALQSKSKSEAALFELSKQHLLGLGETQIRMDLLLEKKPEFTQTNTYQLVRREFARIKGTQPPFVMMPDINLKSEKISGSRKMSTAIFAKSVNNRYQQCMKVGIDKY
jgi:Protein of unknown function (DUF1615)